MKLQKTPNVLALSAAMRWLECIEEYPTDCEIGRSLGYAVRAYIRELRYRLGTLRPYADDLDRLHRLKEAMHALDPLYDALATLDGEGTTIPEEIQSLLTFMAHIVVDIGGAIYHVENQYPQWADAFAAERRLYSEWQAGRGPLAGEPWPRDYGAGAL